MGKKWNPDAKPSEKLLAMYSMLLFGGREASLTELAATLGCTKQTVLRLVTQLEGSRFGKLLRDKRGRESVYRLDRPKTPPKLSLNAEGLRQLALCRDFLLHLLPNSVRKTLDATLEQASAYLPEGESSDAPLSVGESFAKGRIEYSPFQDMFQSLVTAIRQQKVCEVKYKASILDEGKSFEFAPKRLVAYREALHVHGRVVSAKGTARPLFAQATTLSLHRLQKVLVTRRGAGHIPDVETEDNAAFGVMDRGRYAVEVKFAPSAASYVAERQWSNDQKIVVHDDGAVTLSMSVRSPKELISWVLSFGDAAELLAPAELRKKMAGQARALAARYT